MTARAAFVGTCLAIALAMRPGTLVLAAGTASPPSPPSGVPSPSEQPPSPAASTAPGSADCGSVAARLPAEIDGVPVEQGITAGVAAIDPDELLDPLLVSLGRMRSDVCLVDFHAGKGAGALAGQVLRIAGVDVSDLAERFSSAIGARLRAYGAQVLACDRRGRRSHTACAGGDGGGTVQPAPGSTTR